VTRPHLRSITLALIMLFVGVLFLAELVIVGYRYFDRSEALIALEAIRIADDISVVASLVDQTPPEGRSKLLANLSGSDLPVSLGTKPWVSGGAEDSKEARLLRELLLRVLPQTGEITVQFARSDTALPPGVSPPAMLWRKAGLFPEPIRHIIDELVAEPTFLVSVRLRDGTWLNLIAAYVEDIDFWPLHSILVLAGLTIIVAALSIWGIARLTAPFKSFATAARRLGTDVNAKPIIERGPEDVRGAIRAFNEMQRRLQRLIEDRTQMLAAVSHDLRTPITRLRLRAEFVQNTVQRAKFLEDLNGMERMTADLLSFAKEDSHSEPTTWIDLTATLHSICDELADDGYDVSFNDNGRVLYPCRPVSIRRCLSNLIDNALKYGQGATVRLEVRDEEVAIVVDDRGPGIRDDLKEEVFRPFYRLETSRNRETGGSGLGLTVARTVARAHGGDVILGDSPKGGLRASVVLPITEKPSAPQFVGGEFAPSPERSSQSALP
jgi:signal transduction histidine kinase